MPKPFRDIARKFVDAQTEEDRMKLFDELGDGELFSLDEKNEAMEKASKLEKENTVIQARYEELNTRYKDIIFGGTRIVKDDEDEPESKPQAKTLEELGF